MKRSIQSAAFLVAMSAGAALAGIGTGAGIGNGVDAGN